MEIFVYVYWNFAEQTVNRIFAIIFLRIMGSKFLHFCGMATKYLTYYSKRARPSSLPSSVSRSTIDSVNKKLEVS